MGKNRQLITTHSTVDSSTGEELSSYEKPIVFPEKITVETGFVKLCNRAIEEIHYKQLGSFVKIAGYLEYETNRFADIHVGRTPKPLKQKDFKEILAVSYRTVGTLFKELIEKNAILRFDGNYYCNPTFATRSKAIYTDILMKMIEIDPSIRKCINNKDKRLMKFA
tara:strand:+ start:191 stop:688 length:498 start_codon:yes stop_codon:yes gene_type:complete